MLPSGVFGGLEQLLVLNLPRSLQSRLTAAVDTGWGLQDTKVGGGSWLDCDEPCRSCRPRATAARCD